MNILQYHQIQPIVLGQSQKGQDSLIDFTFEKIGTTNKYYVEFGAYDGVEMCNTWYLKHKKNWDGLLLEGNPQFNKNLEDNLHIRWITKDNICNLFSEFNVPNEFDFLCVDLDGIDYWVIKSIFESNYSPRVIMVETDATFEPYESFVLKYDSKWNGDWHGGSPYAFKKLCDSANYAPVWMHEDDMFIIRKDVLAENGYNIPDWSYVYSKPLLHLYGGRIPSKMEMQEV